MDAYTKKIRLLASRILDDQEVISILRKLDPVGGLKVVEFYPDKLDIEYQIYKLTEESVREKARQSGFPLFEKKEKKAGFFRRWIDSLAQSNRETFGSKKPDCCQMNQNEKS